MFKHLILLLIPTAWSWSKFVHEHIAELASDLLTDETKLKLQSITGEERVSSWLIRQSGWADTDEAKNISLNGESGDYHFAHTSRRCEPFLYRRDCKGGKCIVSGIFRHIRTIVSDKSNSEDRIRSLKYLIHYMTDIHQPLHVGFKADRGGNLIRPLSRFRDKRTGRSMDLHSIWDGQLFQRSGLPSRETVERIGIPVQSVDFSSTWEVVDFISRIATETSTDYTCKYAYIDLQPRAPDGNIGPVLVKNGIELSDRYYAAGQRAVDNQVIRASVRLGYLLNEILKYVEVAEPSVAEALKAAVTDETLRLARDEAETATLVAASVKRSEVQFSEVKEEKALKKRDERVDDSIEGCVISGRYEKRRYIQDEPDTIPKDVPVVSVDHE